MLFCMPEEQPTADALHRRIPIRSLRGQTEEASASLRDSVYLEELERQAVIVGDNIASAWRRAMGGCSSTDSRVWAKLQAALFAAIVVQRVLQPGRVHRYPHHQARQESQDFADARGNRLRGMVGLAADAVLLRTQSVRDPFEHVDERLDQLMTPDAISLSDWYISTGKAFMTPESSGNSTIGGYGLRVFFPEGGLLYFGRKSLDLYALDIEMLELRRAIDSARKELEKRVVGRNLFGGSQLVDLLPVEHVRRRADAWLSEREQRGQGLGVRLVEVPAVDDQTS